jgi:hypothetical protein
MTPSRSRRTLFILLLVLAQIVPVGGDGEECGSCPQLGPPTDEMWCYWHLDHTEITVDAPGDGEGMCYHQTHYYYYTSNCSGFFPGLHHDDYYWERRTEGGAGACCAAFGC